MKLFAFFSLLLAIIALVAAKETNILQSFDISPEEPAGNTGNTNTLKPNQPRNVH